MEQGNYGVGINVELAVKTLSTIFVDGFKQVLPETGEIVPEVTLDTVYGKLRFKTRPVNPDSVSVVYLNGNRLYKVMIDCRLSRDPNDIQKYILEKLDRESFIRQVGKVLEKPVAA